MVRRRLIDQDTFDKTITESATTAEFELRGASDVVAKTLKKEALSFYCFDDNRVLYETADDTYIQANYSIRDNNVIFENIEEVIVDENSKKTKMRKILGEMFDSILDEQQSKTNSLFNQYLEMKKYGKKMMDKKKMQKKKMKFMGKKCMGDDCMSTKMKMKDMKESVRSMKGKGRKFYEALLNLSNNVLDYVDYINYGPLMSETTLKHDDKGNVVALKMPTNETRNANKLLSFDWKTLDSEVKSLREMANGINNDKNFCKAIFDLKRQANLADENALGESLEQISRQWPAVLYLTQSELSSKIAEALEAGEASNYDDQTCDFMAEGILRTACEIWTDRANRILHLAGGTNAAGSDPYDHFQEACEKLYTSVDQKFGVQKQVFSDLYQAVYEVAQQADRRGDEAVKQDGIGYLNELAEILKGESKADVELAEEVAKWLVHIVETNLEMSPWHVSNTPHVTVSGDHPDMAKKAAHPYTPARDFSGDWGDPAPALDDMGGSYKGSGPDQMRNNSWGQQGGDNVFPGLKNPYVPSAGEFTMGHEAGVDKDWSKAHGSYQDGDTWPGLQNPYVPKSIQTWKMNHNPEDLVVNK